MKKVIVTGANGFIGSSLIRRLLREQIEVIAIDISFTKPNLPENSLITRLETGLECVEALVQQIPAGEFDAFYHLAWQGVNGADKANPNVQIGNIEMAVNCAAAAKQLGCQRFLCAGTVAEQATNSLERLKVTGGGMLYGVAKHCTRLMLETYCKNIGLRLIWMQFSNIYGPLNKTGNLVSYTLGQLQAGEVATFGPALQPYDFIFVGDLIEAVYRLGDADTEKNLFFIGSGEPRRLKEYLYEIGRLCGKEALIQTGRRPDDGILYSMDMFDTTALKAVIGDYVSMTFSEGIRYTVDHYE